MNFTNFFDKIMLSSLFSFSLTNFYPLFYLKQALCRLKHPHELSRFFVCCQQYRFRDINSSILQTSAFKSTIESFWGSMWFTYFVALYSYLYSFQKQVSASSFRKKQLLLPWSGKHWSSRQQIYWNRTWPVHQMCLRGYFLRIFAALKECLIIIIVIIMIMIMIMIIIIIIIIIITNKIKAFAQKMIQSKNFHRCRDINKNFWI